MVAIDTNVLLRLVINDDELQASKARVLLETQAADGHFLLVADGVQAELVLALDKRHARPPEDVCAALKAFAENATVVAESSDCLHDVIALCEHGQQALQTAFWRSKPAMQVAMHCVHPKKNGNSAKCETALTG